MTFLSRAGKNWFSALTRFEETAKTVVLGHNLRFLDRVGRRRRSRWGRAEGRKGAVVLLNFHAVRVAVVNVEEHRWADFFWHLAILLSLLFTNVFCYQLFLKLFSYSVLFACYFETEARIGASYVF